MNLIKSFFPRFEPNHNANNMNTRHPYHTEKQQDHQQAARIRPETKQLFSHSSVKKSNTQKTVAPQGTGLIITNPPPLHPLSMAHRGCLILVSGIELLANIH
jgi:hypothetical protein